VGRTWQLWSCIRSTTVGGKNGKTRFFYHRERQSLADTDWKPMGIAALNESALDGIRIARLTWVKK